MLLHFWEHDFVSNFDTDCSLARDSALNDFKWVNIVWQEKLPLRIKQANLQRKHQRHVITAPWTGWDRFSGGHSAHNALAAEACFPFPSPVMSQRLAAGGEQGGLEKRDWKSMEQNESYRSLSKAGSGEHAWAVKWPHLTIMCKAPVIEYPCHMWVRMPNCSANQITASWQLALV